MPMVTAEQIREAMDFAQKLRAHDQDQHHLVKVLLDFHDQISYLQPVAHAAERYLHSGLGETEHALLLRALDAMRKAQTKRSLQEPPSLGLD